MNNFNLSEVTLQFFDDSSAKDKVLARKSVFDNRLVKEMQGKGAGVYWAVNPQDDPSDRGIDNTKELKRLGLDLDVAKESDHLPKEEIENRKVELLKKLKSIDNPPNYVIWTKNGLQPFYIFKNGRPLDSIGARREANSLYEDLVRGFGKVTGLKSEGDSICRVLRLPGTKHLKTPSDPYEITIEEINPDPIDLEIFIETYPPVKKEKIDYVSRRAEIANGVPDGQRHIAGPEYIGYLLHYVPESEWETLVWPAFQNWNVGPKNDFPLKEEELRRIFDDIAGKELGKRKKGKIIWPAPLEPEAFIGPVGEIVKVIAPHSEADEAALLVNILSAFGSVIGNSPHFLIEADRHTARLFVVLVGTTGGGRKGTATGYIRKIFSEVDPEWVSKIQTGLSSGEGLIWAVRDPIYKNTKQKDGTYLEEIIDSGIEDKRMLVIESEFSRTLRVMAREGNTLSEIIRLAWDTGDLQALTKNSPAKATNSHVSIIGNITPIELTRKLTETDVGNGFANRFLFICSKRSKFLPEGGKLQESDLEIPIAKLKDAYEFAKKTGEMFRAGTTGEIWRDIYPSLVSDKEGIIGDLTSRADAIVTRLSMVYALSCQSEVIQPEHLMGALAVWRYVEDSVKYIFQGHSGDYVADRILDSLRRHGTMTSTEIYNLFDRHQKSSRIKEALNLLKNMKLIKQHTEKTDGRDSTSWSIVEQEGDEA